VAQWLLKKDVDLKDGWMPEEFGDSPISVSGCALHMIRMMLACPFITYEYPLDDLTYGWPHKIVDVSGSLFIHCLVMYCFHFYFSKHNPMVSFIDINTI
jgi:hypothetical protein